MGLEHHASKHVAQEIPKLQEVQLRHSLLFSMQFRRSLPLQTMQGPKVHRSVSPRDRAMSGAPRAMALCCERGFGPRHTVLVSRPSLGYANAPQHLIRLLQALSGKD